MASLIFSRSGLIPAELFQAFGSQSKRRVGTKYLAALGYKLSGIKMQTYALRMDNFKVNLSNVMDDMWNGWKWKYLNQNASVQFLLDVSHRFGIGNDLSEKTSEMYSDL